MDSKYLIRYAGNDLYRYGLSLFKFGTQKRSKLYNPSLIFVIIFSHCIKFITSLFIESSDVDFHLLTGDFIYFLGAKDHLGMACFTYGSLAVLSQIMHFIYYWKDMKPSYLTPFEMMSALISPKEMGFTNNEDLKKLFKMSKICLNITNAILKSGFILAVFICGIPLTMNSNTYQFIFLVIPWVLLFVLFVHYSAAFLLFQVNYFLIICFYLRIKLKRINKIISDIIQTKRHLRVHQIIIILKKINDIHIEIEEINGNHWSKFLFFFNISIIFIINVFLFEIIFSFINSVFELYRKNWTKENLNFEFEFEFEFIYCLYTDFIQQKLISNEAVFSTVDKYKDI